MTSYPKLSVGIVSFNRLRYLRVLIDSIRECFDYPNLEFLLADGGSVEPGLQEFLGSLHGFRVRSEPETHADSVNWLIREATGEVLMILPEDIQFVRKGKWIFDSMELLLSDENAGSVVFDAQRKVTVKRQLLERRLCIRGRELPFLKTRRRPKVFEGSNGEKFFGAADSRDGLSVAGIMGMSRIDLLREIGSYQISAQLSETPSNDSSLGAEDNMIQRVRNHPVWSHLEAYLMMFPVAADVATDERGTKAKVRSGNRRYGAYRSPAEGRFYYRVRPATESLTNPPSPFPVWPFESWVEPVGFELPLDANGDLKKVSVIREDEPWTDVRFDSADLPWSNTRN